MRTFPSASHRLQGNVGLSPYLWASVCFFYFYGERRRLLWGGLQPPWVLGWHLMLGRCGIWQGKRAEQRFLSHHRGSPRWRPFMSKDPPLLQTHSPPCPFYNQPCRQRCISCKLEKPGTLNLRSLLIKFSCKIQLQFPYL